MLSNQSSEYAESTEPSGLQHVGWSAVLPPKFCGPTRHASLAPARNFSALTMKTMFTDTHSNGSWQRELKGFDLVCLRSVWQKSPFRLENELTWWVGTEGLIATAPFRRVPGRFAAGIDGKDRRRQSRVCRSFVRLLDAQHPIAPRGVPGSHEDLSPGEGRRVA